MLLQLLLFYGLLACIVVLLFLMWRESVKRTSRTTLALIDVATKAAEAAQKSAEAAERAVAYLEKKRDAH